jgi:ankyrin repeat protein
MHRLMLLTALFTIGCTPAPRSPFAKAIAADDPDAVRGFLRDGEPVDQREEHGLTPLMWAARDGSLRAMAALIDAGADVNARDTNNHWTPLLHAVHKQKPAAVALLLARGADPNAAAGGMTALMMAADDPRPEMVKTLLDYGADPRVPGPGGATPLSQAVSGGAFTDITDRPLLGGCHPATVRAFIERDPTLRVPANAAGHSAVWWARFHGCDEVLRLIGVPPTKTGQTAVSALGVAHEKLREKRTDAPEPPPATGDGRRH